jgi:signal transduction histidine kinase
MSRLQMRLFVPTALILVLCVGAIGLFTHVRTQRDFTGFQNAQQAETYTTQARELAAISLLRYLRGRSWADVQQNLEGMHLAATVVIVNGSGEVLATTGAAPVGRHWTPPASAFSAQVGRLLLGKSRATLYVVPRASVSATQTAFLKSVDRGLLLAVLAGLGAALAMTFVVTRRIVGPIAAMTAAAARMRRGELAQRVSVPGSGDEIAKLADSFNAMAAGLQEAERQRQALTADVAHELRTPLTSIRGYLEALQDGAVAPTAAVIDSMHEEVLALTNLMGDLQDLALADAGALRLHPQPQAVEPLLVAAVTA